MMAVKGEKFNSVPLGRARLVAALSGEAVRLCSLLGRGAGRESGRGGKDRDNWVL